MAILTRCAKSTVTRSHLLNSRTTWCLRFVICCSALWYFIPPLHSESYAAFPQFAFGGGWSADIFLTNQGSGTVSGVIVSFYGDNGSQMKVDSDLGTGSRFTLSLNGGSTTIIRVTSTSSLRVGYVVVTSPEGVSLRGTEVLRFEQDGVLTTVMGVPQQILVTHYSFPAEVDSTRQINTGVAIANPSDWSRPVAQTVLVSLIRSDGTLQATVPVPLGLGEHVSMYLNDPRLFPGLDDFVGSVSVSGVDWFGLVAFRQDHAVFGALSIDWGPILGPFLLNTSPIGEVESNDTAAQAQLISGSAVVSGSIDSAGDVDYFTFNGKRGDVISALLDTRSLTSTLDSVLRLEKADGTIVTENDQNWLLGQNDSFIHLALPSDGAYYLRVSDYFGNGGSDCTYRLHLRLAESVNPPNPPQITSLSPSLLTQGASATLIIQGSYLSGATSIGFNPSDGITASNIQSSLTQVTATVTASSTASPGARQVSVTTPAGTSNALVFTVTSSGFASDGSYSGPTSDAGRNIAFTVDSNGTRIPEMGLGFADVPCKGGGLVSVSIPGGISVDKFTGPISILNGSFSANINVPATDTAAGAKIAVNGQFTSATSASGTIEFVLTFSDGSSCTPGTLTWSATKK